MVCCAGFDTRFFYFSKCSVYERSDNSLTAHMTAENTMKRSLPQACVTTNQRWRACRQLVCTPNGSDASAVLFRVSNFLRFGTDFALRTVGDPGRSLELKGTIRPSAVSLWLSFPPNVPHTPSRALRAVTSGTETLLARHRGLAILFFSLSAP